MSSASVDEANWSADVVEVVATPLPDRRGYRSSGPSIRPADARRSRAAGAPSPAALAGDVDAVVAAPHNQTAIAAAGIAFDGYPGFLARETGTREDDVFLMLCFASRRIVHCTLHVSVRDALALITQERVGSAIRATEAALRRLGSRDVRRFSSVGSILTPVKAGCSDARRSRSSHRRSRRCGETIDVEGPYGCDTMLNRRDADAYIVMLHDQGHIPAKLAGTQSAAVAIGTPVLFSSVAHGTAMDIAGKGIADPAALIAAIGVLTGHPI